MRQHDIFDIWMHNNSKYISDDNYICNILWIDHDECLTALKYQSLLTASESGDGEEMSTNNDGENF